MDERLDNIRIPNIIAPGVEAPSREGPRTFARAEDAIARAGEVVTLTLAGGTGATTAGDRFHSRFKGWIRAVALTIILVFVPEQASWAFNYNPLVLWGNKTGDRVQGLGDSDSDQHATNDERRDTNDPDALLRSGRDSDRADSERRSEIISLRRSLSARSESRPLRSSASGSFVSRRSSFVAC